MAGMYPAPCSTRRPCPTRVGPRDQNQKSMPLIRPNVPISTFAGKESGSARPPPIPASTPKMPAAVSRRKRSLTQVAAEADEVSRSLSCCLRPSLSRRDPFTDSLVFTDSLARPLSQETVQSPMRSSRPSRKAKVVASAKLDKSHM